MRKYFWAIIVSHLICRAFFLGHKTGHAITGPLSGYVEFWNVSPREAGAQWQATADAGVTWAIGDNLQLDAGVNRGLNAATPDLNVFTGFTVRF